MPSLNHDEVKAMVEEIGLLSAYDHFAEGESPDPPFIVFLFPGSDNFAADGTAYYKQNILNLELYTDMKDPDLEEAVESVLENHRLFYEKSEIWIAEEKLYEVLYETEV